MELYNQVLNNDIELERCKKLFEKTGKSKYKRRIQEIIDKNQFALSMAHAQQITREKKKNKKESDTIDMKELEEKNHTKWTEQERKNKRKKFSKDLAKKWERK